jgi:hypothetical protein
MPRFICAAFFALLLIGCGESGGDSYTSKALAELRAGNTADWAEKKKRPPAKEVAIYEKKAKNFKAGSKNDLYQALWILSNQREHEELHFNTMAKSTYLREAYFRVFGPPDESRTNQEPNVWSHKCTDGAVTLRGFLKDKGDPKNLTTYPHKPK